MTLPGVGGASPARRAWFRACLVHPGVGRTPGAARRSDSGRRHPPASLRQHAAHAYTPDCPHPPRTTAQGETCRPHGLIPGLFCLTTVAGRVGHRALLHRCGARTCTVANGLLQATLKQKGGCVGGCAGASRTPLRSVPARRQGRGCPSPANVGPLARPGEFRGRLDGAERNGYPWQRHGRSARSRSSPRCTRLSKERKTVPTPPRRDEPCSCNKPCSRSEPCD